MIPWTAARQAPLSMEFSRQKYCSGLPFSSPGDLPNPCLLYLLHWQADSVPLSHLGSTRFIIEGLSHICPLSIIPGLFLHPCVVVVVVVVVCVCVCVCVCVLCVRMYMCVCGVCICMCVWCVYGYARVGVWMCVGVCMHLSVCM